MIEAYKTRNKIHNNSFNDDRVNNLLNYYLGSQPFGWFHSKFFVFVCFEANLI